MARTIEKYKHVSEQTRITKLTCDLCKKKAPEPEGFDGNKWGEGEMAVESVMVGYKSGENWYGEGGKYTTTFFDICPDCFKNTLMPFLIGCGAEPQVKKVSW